MGGITTTGFWARPFGIVLAVCILASGLQTPLSPGSSALAQPASCSPCTLWASTSTPSTDDTGDASSIEVGVRFHSDAAGYISGIRFYKSVANVGPHIGSLWTTDGVQLGAVTFTSETTSGWQQATFSAPVAVTADTEYVASYHTSSGHYARDAFYFQSAAVDAPPLHAPSS